MIAGQPPDLVAFLDDAARRELAACTGCGRCVEVCPVLPHSDAHDASPRAVVGEVLAHLRDGTPPGGPARAWRHACNGCGDCVPACPEGVNPRRLLLLSTIRDAQVASDTPQLFRRMARAIKLMAAMQLVPADYARLLEPPSPRPAPVVFYTGCNAVRTPNLLFNAMQLLDAVGVDYAVVGGPSSCCGVIATKWEGEPKVGERVSWNTLRRFERFTPDRVLSWCPTCQLHLGETLAGFGTPEFAFGHLTPYLVEHVDRLAAGFVRPVTKRAVLHAHRGMAEVGRAVQTLLARIPGLALVDTVWESSYTCGGSGCNRAPTLRDAEHRQLVDRVEQTGADLLVTLYHGCHMAFLGAERPGGPQVVNFTDLLVDALGGVRHDDRLKHLRQHAQWRDAVEEALPLLAANGLPVDPDWLERHGPEIFSVAEFRGGLDCLSTPAPLSAGTAR